MAKTKVEDPQAIKGAVEAALAELGPAPTQEDVEETERELVLQGVELMNQIEATPRLSGSYVLFGSKTADPTRDTRAIVFRVPKDSPYGAPSKEFAVLTRNGLREAYFRNSHDHNDIEKLDDFYSALDSTGSISPGTVGHHDYGFLDGGRRADSLIVSGAMAVGLSDPKMITPEVFQDLIKASVRRVDAPISARLGRAKAAITIVSGVNLR